METKDPIENPEGISGEADKGIKIPEGKQEHEEWIPTDAENRALAGGWRPENEWEGEPDDFVGAREFNFRGELMQRITKQGRALGQIEGQLSEARNMIAASDRVTQKLIKDAVDKTRRDLRSQRRAAMEDDDHNLVDQIDEELDDLKDAQSEIKDTQGSVATAAPAHQPTPIEAAWFTFVTSTPWVQEPQMNATMLQYASSVRDSDPEMSVGDFMEKVLDKGKELRGLKKPAAPRGGPDDGKGGNRGGRNRRASTGFTASDLNEQQKFIGQGFVDEGIIKTLDDYAKELGEAGGLEKQR